MKEEEQRIEIAEACGLFRLAPLRRTTRRGKESPEGVVLWYCESHHGGAAEYHPIPDYPTDLNAMHEAEGKLPSAAALIDYDSFLSFVCGRDAGTMHARIWKATAPQRAEAFLRTLNLWKDTP